MAVLVAVLGAILCVGVARGAVGLVGGHAGMARTRGVGVLVVGVVVVGLVVVVVAAATGGMCVGSEVTRATAEITRRWLIACIY